MSELLQEFVDSRRQELRVDRDGGVIRGVKLLGLASRNGRRYRENALIEAIGLYEGAKVNVNHPKGHALAPRDYQDRLGIVRGVQFRRGEGLFGDLHFNPRHALSEQLVWDAEHAPQNVGMSHNVLARTKQAGDEIVVEAITKVQSIDLVADPATTSGLYEHTSPASSEVNANAKMPATDANPIAFDVLTLEHLRLHRPDLVREIEAFRSEELRAAQQQLDEALALKATIERRELVIHLLQEHNLPVPGPSAADSQPVSSRFVDTLMQAPNVETVRQRVEERAGLIRSTGARVMQQRMATRPRSRGQLEFSFMSSSKSPRSGAEFAAALR
jgi:hypothetical protein